MDSEDEVGALLADSAERFLASHHTAARSRIFRLTADTNAESAFWRAVAEQGWLGLRLPERVGGAGLALRPAIALARAFGTYAAPDPLIACGLLPGAVIALLPDPATVAELASDFASGTRRIAVVWQTGLGQVEPALGAIRAVTDGSVTRLSGRAMCVARPADTLLVLAVADGEPVLVQTEAVGEGTSWEEMRLSDGSRLGHACFNDAVGQVLCKSASALEAVRLGLLEAMIASSALLEALAAKAFAITLAYCKQRVQFGVPLTDQQVVQHRLVDYRMQLMLSAASWRKALQRYEATSGSDTTRAAVHAAKARCSETALAVTRGAIQLHGAIGYTEEADIGIYLRAAVRHAAAFGNASPHRAKFLATSGAQQAA